MEQQSIIRKHIFTFLAGGVVFWVLFPIVGFLLYYTRLITDNYAIEYGGLGALVLTWILLFQHLKKRGWDWKLFVVGVFGSIVAVVLSLWIAVNLNRHPHSTSAYRDGRKISNIKQIQLALELYADANDSLYPPTPSACTNIEALNQYLVPQYLPQNVITEQIKLLVPDYPNDFQIAIASDRKGYVIRVKFEDIKNISKYGDSDGQLLGCNCDGDNYCVAEGIKP